MSFRASASEPDSRLDRGLLAFIRFASVLLIFLWTLTGLNFCLSNSVVFDGVFYDGAFQLFNPLRRIAAGQHGGVDFQFFHGLAIPYLHYPWFVLFGGDLFASELSRHVVSFIVFLFEFPVLFYAVTRRGWDSLALTAGTLILIDQLALYELVYPYHSLRGLRSALPFYTMAPLFFRLPWRWESALAGASAGSAFLLGIDQGIGTSLMLGIVWIGRRRAAHPAGRLAWLALAAASFLLTVGGFLFAVGGAHGATAALRYALIEIPADQFWYFGAPPNPYLRNWGDVGRDWVLLATLAAAQLLGMALRLGVRSDPLFADQGRILLAGLAYGLFVSLGYLAIQHEGYLMPLQRTEAAILLILLWRAARAGSLPLRRGLFLVGSIVLSVCVLSGPNCVESSSLRHAVDSIAFFRQQVEGLANPKLSPRVQEHLDVLVRAIDADRAAVGITRPPVIWSTYAGLLEDHYRVFHPHCDYTIHAIGPDRRADYLEAFRKTEPDYVCTHRRNADGFLFEEWLQQTSWPFYEEVLLNYQPLVRSASFILWKRRPTPWRLPQHEGSVRFTPAFPDRFSVEAPPGADPGATRVVELEYDLKPDFGWLPLLGKSTRYKVAFANARNETPLFLPPSEYGGRWTLIVRPEPGQTPECRLTTEGLLGGSVQVKLVTVRVLAVDAEAAAQTLFSP